MGDIPCECHTYTAVLIHSASGQVCSSGVCVCSSDSVVVSVCVGNNSCTDENGGCLDTQLCLYRPTGHVCVCPPQLSCHSQFQPLSVSVCLSICLSLSL